MLTSAEQFSGSKTRALGKMITKKRLSAKSINKTFEKTLAFIKNKRTNRISNFKKAPQTKFKTFDDDDDDDDDDDFNDDNELFLWYGWPRKGV